MNNQTKVSSALFLQALLQLFVIITSPAVQATESSQVPAAIMTAEQGWVQFKKGEYDAALQLARQLSEQAVVENDISAEYQALNLINAVKYTQNQYTAELLKNEYRQEQIAMKLGDQQMLAKILNNLGYDLLTTGGAPLAEIIPRLQRANDIYAMAEGHAGRWYTLMNLTWAHRQAGDLASSIVAGEKAVAQAEAINDRHAIIETSLNLAESLVADGRIAAADKLLASAKQQAVKDVDRDRHVYEIYAAQHMLDTGQPGLDSVALVTAINAVEPHEVFYEMLGRSVLAQWLFEQDKFNEALSEADKVLDASGNFVPREALERAAAIKARITETKD